MVKQGKYVYDWPRPMLTVDTVLFGFVDGKTKVLLVKRSKEPFKGKWALPGGFVEMDEQLRDSAARELAEETGVTGIELKQMHTFGKPGRDPRGRNITVAFMGVAEKDLPDINAGDDAQEVRWFDIDALGDLAFDHNEIVKMAVRKLTAKQHKAQSG